ncbi:hypothetical protein BN1058_02483 [Paraliobacillus sp. PM-2]|uniref:DUF2953 domain-containing protein n=1 Tax=Paraliobacillus sp. PM-2 TaxID=1462524 RepID=UPI00061C03FE|nr:DUF2953 domain-containing protein [Paraliobacillus sp. PM-2]CQR48135.1 hypothetical protein BN1058_02483 [Paraliobacillus sp. PM-2]
MFILVIIIVLLFCFLIFSIFLPVKLQCKLAYNEELILSMKITIAYIPILTYDKQWNGTTDHASMDLEVLTEKIKMYKNGMNENKKINMPGIRIIKHLKKITLEIIQWDTTIGMEDAASTGIFTGLLWSIKGSLLAILDQSFHLKEVPVIQVHSDFEKLTFQSTYECIFSLRLGQAIYTFRKINQSVKGLNS